MQFAKIPGVQNPADLMTKYLSREVMEKFVHKLGFEWSSGRAEKAVFLNMVATALDERNDGYVAKEEEFADKPPRYRLFKECEERMRKEHSGAGNLQ